MRIAVGLALLVTVGIESAGAAPFAAPDDPDDWLATVNAYRAASGLDPVVEVGTQSTDAGHAARFMVVNGLLTHNPSADGIGYDESVARAAGSSNLVLTGDPAATAADLVDLWMGAPFHAIGILRPGWQSTGFAMTTGPADRDDQIRTAGVLDVLSGLTDEKVDGAVVFPGAGSSTHLRRFIAEWPDPLDWCEGYDAPAGLPLLALLPTAPSATSATLTDVTDGTPLESCTLTADDIVGKDPTSSTARTLLEMDDAVIVIPRHPLEDGHQYRVSIRSSTNVSWRFGAGVEPSSVYDEPFVTRGSSSRFRAVSGQRS